MDRAERNQKQREYRAKTGNDVTKRYERTPQGKLMRTYRNMQSRVTGILHTRRHLYEGKEILSREAFYEWAQSSPDFWRLFEGWAASGYRCGASPCVDRLDPANGYTLDNMQWITHSENSRRAFRGRHEAVKTIPLAAEFAHARGSE